MKLGLYGLPCAGKTYLLEKLQGVQILHGSNELNKLSGGKFFELSEEEKHKTRIKYAEYVNSLSSKFVISDGHYSFLDDIVFTESDGILYDIILYLYCEPKILSDRFNQSQKNCKYKELSIAMIEQWQNFEINSLRNECHKRNKDFYVISDGMIANSKFKSFLELLKSGFSSYKLAREIVSQIKDIYPNPTEIHLIDGDKTLIKQDSFRFCCNGKTTVFDGDFYTAYQSYLFGEELNKKTLNINNVESLVLNENIKKMTDNAPYIILSSGITEVWKQISEYLSLKNVVANHMISADTKYYVAKLLKEKNYKVIAHGDSKVDLYMLQEADESYLYIYNKLSNSLIGENIKGINLIYDLTPYILQSEKYPAVLNDIAICKSNSGINGSKLAVAHMKLGQQLGNKISQIIPSKNTDVIVLERGGRFFGDGLYCAFGGTFHSYSTSTSNLPVLYGERVIIVDSVINTGKSILEIINNINNLYSKKEIIIASNVIQNKAVLLFEQYKIFTVRISDNSFVGKRQIKQIGKTGPDTADRLFNNIKSYFE